MTRLAKIFRLLIPAALLSLSGCDDGSSQGYIHLQVENARGPAGLASLPALDAQGASSDDQIKVTQFKITISGDGIDTSLVSTADASASQMQVTGIPAGPNRTILIEALNKDGTVIRRRKVENVEITPGVVTPIKTSLNTVPIVLNLKSGSVVISKNFHVVGFGEPGGGINLEAKSKDQTISLNESVGGPSVVVSPSLSTGIFDFSPKTALSGKQTLTVVDAETGESSSVDVFVVQGKDRPGRRLLAAGGGKPSIAVGASFGGPKTGNFPAVLRALGGKL